MLPTILVVVCVYVPLGVLLVLAKDLARVEHASVLIEPEFSPSTSLTRGSLWVLGLGAWVWAELMCVVGVLATRARAPLAPMRRLLVGAGLLTLLMFLDDLFQLHKPVVPDATGLPSAVVLGAYALALFLWLVLNRRAILDTDVGVLVIALAFFAMWILVKAAPALPARTSIAAGTKLCGVAGWAAYLTMAAWRTGSRARALRSDVANVAREG